VLATLAVYDRLTGFDSRNVAVNKLTTPSPASTFPMTAIMNFLVVTTRQAAFVFRELSWRGSSGESKKRRFAPARAGLPRAGRPPGRRRWLGHPVRICPPG
jgi:hypothetical protein